jgi:hypothetical protein
MKNKKIANIGLAGSKEKVSERIMANDFHSMSQLTNETNAFV